MLYERWQTVARSNWDQLALWDGGRDREYSFGDLARLADHEKPGSGSFRYAAGAGIDFIVAVLRGWRDGQIVAPIERGQSTPKLNQVPPPGVVHLKSTSASTGAARMIAFTAQQLMADCRNVVTTMGLKPSLPNVGAISLAHSYGFSNLVLPLLLEGVPLLIAESPLPESFRATVRRAAKVAVPAVPALWQTWHEANVVSEQIQIAISAGAGLPLALERNVFKSTGIKIHNFYGSSECGGIAYDRSDQPRDDAALAGAPMEGVRIDASEDGCLIVRSQAVGLGYWPDPGQSLGNGSFVTGDLGEVFADGVYLRGRASERINVAGRKVSPEDVERVLLAHPQVRDCLVFGLASDNLRNETIVACIATASDVVERDLTAFAQARMPSWQVPREWWLMDSLGVNQRGKRSRAEWRQRYLRERRQSSSRTAAT